MLAFLPASWLSSAGTCCQPQWECHHFHLSKQDFLCHPGSSHWSSELLFSGSSFYMPVRIDVFIKGHMCVTQNAKRKKKLFNESSKETHKGFTSSETGSERSKNISVTTDTCKSKVVAI